MEARQVTDIAIVGDAGDAKFIRTLSRATLEALCIKQHADLARYEAGPSAGAEPEVVALARRIVSEYEAEFGVGAHPMTDDTEWILARALLSVPRSVKDLEGQESK